MRPKGRAVVTGAALYAYACKRAAAASAQAAQLRGRGTICNSAQAACSPDPAAAPPPACLPRSLLLLLCRRPASSPEASPERKRCVHVLPPARGRMHTMPPCCPAMTPRWSGGGGARTAGSRLSLLAVLRAIRTLLRHVALPIYHISPGRHAAGGVHTAALLQLSQHAWGWGGGPSLIASLRIIECARHPAVVYAPGTAARSGRGRTKSTKRCVMCVCA